MIDKIDDSPIYKHPPNANKIAGKTTLLNITTCIHCMKCINLCPMHVFEIKEYDNSRIILPTEKATVSNVRHVAGIVLRIVFLLMSRSSTDTDCYSGSRQ